MKTGSLLLKNIVKKKMRKEILIMKKPIILLTL